ncbi:putative integral membrane protein [Alkalibacillus flavidus]|uniref:Integral membrane protein n=1 Tax=Alkalibacillus flavidus TaxID=546021 RepID=A0ABV2KSF1_9BACI
MKQQTLIILTILFTIIIAIFAIINVESVPVDFLFAQTDAPLILVILLSVLLGALVAAGASFTKIYQLQKQLKREQTKNVSETETISTEHEEKNNSEQQDQTITGQDGDTDEQKNNQDT